MKKLIDVYFNTTGRMGRLDFLIYSIPFAIFETIVFSLAYFVSPFFLLLLLLELYPGMAVIIKRFHDMKISALGAVGVALLTVFILFVLYLNPESIFWLCLFDLYIIVLLYWMYIVKGTKGANKYGPNPIKKEEKKQNKKVPAKKVLKTQLKEKKLVKNSKNKKK